MWLEQLRDWLLATEAENDPGFREALIRLSRIGLLVLSIVEVVMTAVMTLASLLLDPRPDLLDSRVGMGISVVIVGLATLVATRISNLGDHARMLGLVSVVTTGFLLTYFCLEMAPLEPSTGYFIPCNMTLILLVTVVALPLRPLQTLSVGGLLTLSYILLAQGNALPGGPTRGAQMTSLIFLMMLSGLACALTAILYNQRKTAWRMHRDVIKASDNLRQAEARNLLAQNAASVGRLAAALSHELNSPVGALVSGVDTLLLLASRQATACEAVTPQQQRLILLQNDLRLSIRESTDRLRQIVTRMQRFTNLDKAEVQAANLNELLSDVAALLEPGWKDRATVDLDLQPLPELVCRPQQLSAVFSSLLGNAVEATDGDGRVRIATRQENSHIEVAIEDNGRGLSPEEADVIFDPGFKVSGGRVASGNWSMFSSRQIVREHGGEITIASRPGRGTRVSVMFPVGQQVLT